MKHRIAGGVSEAVVDELEPVEIEEQDGYPRPTALAAGERMLDPVGEQPPVRQAGQRVRQRRVDETLVDACVLEGNGHVVGEQPYDVEVVVIEMAAHPVQVERTDHAVGAPNRSDDQRLVLVGRSARHVDDARVVSRVVDALGFALADHVAGDARPERRPCGEDLLRVRVACQDRHQAVFGSVDEVDGERVVRHHFRQRVGDRVENRAAVSRQQQALGDGQELALAGESALERLASPLQLFQLSSVEQGHGRLRADDLGEAQVGGVKCARTKADQLDDAQDRVLVDERHDDHRFIDVLGVGDLGSAGIGPDVRDDFCDARSRDVTCKSVTDAHLEAIGGLIGVVGNSAPQHDRLESLSVPSEGEEAQAVPVDDGCDLACDCLGHREHVARSTQSPRERLDALQLLAPAPGV